MFHCKTCCKIIATTVESESDHLLSKEHVNAEFRMTVKDKSNTLTEILTNLSEKKGLNHQDKILRESVYDRVKNALLASKTGEHGSELQVYLFGSSLTGVGLKDCNVDVCYQTYEPEDFFDALNSIKMNGDFSNVEDSLHKMPSRFSFKDNTSGLQCTVSHNTIEAVETSILITRYLSLDKRVLILARCFRYWAKICQIDKGSRGTMNPFCYTLMLIHFLQIKNVLPILVPEDKKTPFWNSNNVCSLDKLWLQLLRYYRNASNDDQFVVSVTQLKRLTKRYKKWSSMVAIENPVNRNVNLAHSFAKKVFEYFKNCFEVSSNYFSNGLQMQSRGEGDGNAKPRRRTMTTSESEIELESAGSTYDNYESDDENENESLASPESGGAESDSSESSDEESALNVQATLDDSDSSSDVEVESENLIDFGDEDVLAKSVKNLTLAERKERSSSATYSTPTQDKKRSNSAPQLPGDAVFDFNRKNLCGKMKLPVYCASCKGIGHLQKNCPNENFMIQPLQRPDEHVYRILTDVCAAIMGAFEPTVEDMHLRYSHLERLETYIQKKHPDAKLSMFGSSINGFGFRKSDMDICMVFNGLTVDDINPKSLVVDIGKHLRQCRFVRNIQVIKNAKVPIAKFVFADGQIEADISLYNTLAVENTKLLFCYCSIDQRLRILAYALKFFAKTCEICDASRGTLSSYAHIVLLIHFLQQRKPPVLPVLQELYNSKKKKPSNHVEGWNAWFFSDLKSLDSVWPGYGKNKESVGQLWSEFFRYYVEEFNFKRNVVTIRQSKPMIKSVKSWNRFPMAIEDPFKLDHNLGAGITVKVFRHIIGILINGRTLYSQPITEFDCSVGNLTQIIYGFFDASLLTKGLAMPQDRLCRKCGKIGHTRKTCQFKEAGTKKTDKMPRKKVADRRKAAIGLPEEVLIDQPKEMASDRPREMASDRPKEMASDRPKEMASDRPREMASDRPKEMASDRPKEMASGRPKKMASGRPKEKVSEDSDVHAARIEELVLLNLSDMRQDVRDKAMPAVKPRSTPLQLTGGKPGDKSSGSGAQPATAQKESCDIGASVEHPVDGDCDQDDVIEKLSMLLDKAKRAKKDKRHLKAISKEASVLERSLPLEIVEQSQFEAAASESTRSARPRVERSDSTPKQKEQATPNLEGCKKKPNRKEIAASKQKSLLDNFIAMHTKPREDDNDNNETNEKVTTKKPRPRNRKKSKSATGKSSESMMDSDTSATSMSSHSRQTFDDLLQNEKELIFAKVPRTNLARSKNNDQFLSLLTLNSPLAFTSPISSKDDSEFHRASKHEDGVNRGGHNSRRGHRGGASSRGRGSAMSGSGASFQSMSELSGDHEGSSRGRGQNRGQNRARGRARGKNRGQHRGRGNQQGGESGN